MGDNMINSIPERNCIPGHVHFVSHSLRDGARVFFKENAVGTWSCRSKDGKAHCLDPPPRLIWLTLAEIMGIQKILSIAHHFLHPKRPKDLGCYFRILRGIPHIPVLHPCPLAPTGAHVDYRSGIVTFAMASEPSESPSSSQAITSPTVVGKAFCPDLGTQQCNRWGN